MADADWQPGDPVYAPEATFYGSCGPCLVRWTAPVDVCPECGQASTETLRAALAAPVRAQSADTTEPRVCSKCGTAGCLEDAESGWYDDTPALAAPGVDTTALGDGLDIAERVTHAVLFELTGARRGISVDVLASLGETVPIVIAEQVRAALAARTPLPPEPVPAGIAPLPWQARDSRVLDANGVELFLVHNVERWQHDRVATWLVSVVNRAAGERRLP